MSKFITDSDLVDLFPTAYDQDKKNLFVDKCFIQKPSTGNLPDFRMSLTLFRLFRGGGGGEGGQKRGGGRRILPAPTLNVNNLFTTKVNATKASDFF